MFPFLWALHVPLSLSFTPCSPAWWAMVAMLVPNKHVAMFPIRGHRLKQGVDSWPRLGSPAFSWVFRAVAERLLLVGGHLLEPECYQLKGGEHCLLSSVWRIRGGQSSDREGRDSVWREQLPNLEGLREKLGAGGWFLLVPQFHIKLRCIHSCWVY